MPTVHSTAAASPFQMARWSVLAHCCMQVQLKHNKKKSDAIKQLLAEGPAGLDFGSDLGSDLDARTMADMSFAEAATL